MVRKPTELVMSKLKALPGDTNVILRVVLLKRFFAYTYIYLILMDIYNKVENNSGWLRKFVLESFPHSGHLGPYEHFVCL